MSNPYEPVSIDEAPPPRHDQTEIPSYRGGMLLVAAIGIGGGLLAGILIVSGNLSGPVTAFGAPAVCLVAAMVTVMGLLKGTEMSVGGKVLLGVLLSVPAYIMYVPSCIAGSMLGSDILGSVGYGPGEMAVNVSSTIAFAVPLVILAAIVLAVSRSRWRHRNGV